MREDHRGLVEGPTAGRAARTRPCGRRPTGLRETLFNVIGPTLDGARVLDGFAGTGALGLEALSRGAAHVTFVERDARALAALGENIAHCGVAEACAIIRDDFFRACAGCAGHFDLVLARSAVRHRRSCRGARRGGGVGRADGAPGARAQPAARLAGGGWGTLAHARPRGGRQRVVVLCDNLIRMAAEPRLAIYPGTFDPLTNGHSISSSAPPGCSIGWSSRSWSTAAKQPVFTVAERVAMIREVCQEHARRSRSTRSRGCSSTTRGAARRAAIVRGLRGVADFEYERQMALMNRHLSAGHRDRVHDAARRVEPPQLDPGQGSGRARRIGRRPRAAGRRRGALDSPARRWKDPRRMSTDTLPPRRPHPPDRACRRR